MNITIAHLGISVVLDRKENKNADLGRFELAYRDNPHPGFKCVDNKFYLEGARIRKYDLQRYSELDKKTRQREKEKQRNRRKQEEAEKMKEVKETSKLKVHETTENANEETQNHSQSDKDYAEDDKESEKKEET